MSSPRRGRLAGPLESDNGIASQVGCEARPQPLDWHRMGAFDGGKVVLEGSEILRRLTESGLRGRGGGWFPAGRKWHAVRIEGGDPVVIGNGAEGEPGSIKDRWVMLNRPREVLRGLVLAANAVGAREAVVYLKGSFVAPAEAL